nr:hypothetical protein [Tanacetum cinerariifolium]
IQAIEKMLKTRRIIRSLEKFVGGRLGISILLAVGTPSTGSGKLYCQWELSSSSGNALCILFPTCLVLGYKMYGFVAALEISIAIYSQQNKIIVAFSKRN